MVASPTEFAMRPLVLLTLLAGTTAAAPVPKAVKKADDKTALVGTWRVTAETLNGRNERVTDDTFMFDAEGILTIRPKNPDMYKPHWTFKLDSEASPRRMQLSLSVKGPFERELVYELDGDTLKVGFINKGANPPAAVEPGDGLNLFVMTRDTPAK